MSGQFKKIKGGFLVVYNRLPPPEAPRSLERLEENFLIQRCGLTPTNLFHLTGQFVKWDTDLAREYTGSLPGF